MTPDFFKSKSSTSRQSKNTVDISCPVEGLGIVHVFIAYSDVRLLIHSDNNNTYHWQLFDIDRHYFVVDRTLNDKT